MELPSEIQRAEDWVGMAMPMVPLASCAQAGVKAPAARATAEIAAKAARRVVMDAPPCWPPPGGPRGTFGRGARGARGRARPRARDGSSWMILPVGPSPEACGGLYDVGPRGRQGGAMVI